MAGKGRQGVDQWLMGVTGVVLGTVVGGMVENLFPDGSVEEGG